GSSLIRSSGDSGGPSADGGYDLPVRAGGGGKIGADIIDVPHHGSKNSSGEDFISAVSPSIAVFEAGKNNYGHPDENVILNYQNAGADILRTDLDGTVSIRYEAGVGYKVACFNSAENQYAWLAWLRK
ncbi:MAG: hypothetical protein FWH55_08105, partial [Oscillospiraceae bacterium]|nr:hypothetical protein [Oscillospiraceae bacterium]